MKTIALAGLVAVTLLGSSAPAKKPHVWPQEHQEFVAQFKSLLEKYPQAAQRFKLADLGDQPIPKHVIVWKCENIGEFGVDCKPEILE